LAFRNSRDSTYTMEGCASEDYAFYSNLTLSYVRDLIKMPVMLENPDTMDKPAISHGRWIFGALPGVDTQPAGGVIRPLTWFPRVNSPSPGPALPAGPFDHHNRPSHDPRHRRALSSVVAVPTVLVAPAVLLALTALTSLAVLTSLAAITNLVSLILVIVTKSQVLNLLLLSAQCFL
jgi:hypothetical protein